MLKRKRAEHPDSESEEDCTDNCDSSYNETWFAKGTQKTRKARKMDHDDVEERAQRAYEVWISASMLHETRRYHVTTSE
ncbi:hypothetical protein BDR07DRAFT_1395675 [Suillus spraguei]|nr:hypothetical protein BDR07DRAFT_1395675 [Suillus spraguei]